MKLAAALLCLVATSATAQYRCVTFGCDMVERVSPPPEPTACTITISYSTDDPQGSQIRYRGNGCEATIVPALQSALDLSKRGAPYAGAVYPAWPSQDDVYKHQR